MKSIIFVALLALLANGFPLFKQCDSRWANHHIGTSSETICQVGCLMSSASMMLNGYGVSIDGQEANPDTLNTWLVNHGGYVSGDLFVWSAIDGFGFSFETNRLSPSEVIPKHDSGAIVILNVRQGSHWVLMTGHSGNTLNVNDPGFNQASYDLSEVVGAGVYHRTGAASLQQPKPELLTLESFPLYKQCDSRWGSHHIGTSSKTICQVGCLMSSVSMVLKGYGKKLDGKESDPDTLNTWLKNHGGYASGDLFVWSAIDKFGFSFQTNSLPRSEVISRFGAGDIVILNVRGGAHWVLMTGHSGDTLHVNDPGFSVTSYALSDVVAAGVYKHTGALKASNDDRVRIDLYTESLCPGCMQVITTSLKTALNTKDLDKIADIHLWVYGNAHETQQGGKWVYTCQHGDDECYGNLLETCAQNKLDASVTLQFVECVEEQVQSGSDFDSAASTCASNYSVDLTETKACMNSDEGNSLQHQVAVQTENLSPKHQYVPWVTVNGKHDDQDESDVENDMVSFICQHYTGSVKIDACSQITQHENRKVEVCPAEGVVEYFLRRI